MKLSIIIVDYNSSKLIADCLNSWKQYRPNFSFEIIIIDNNSSENHLADYEKILPEVKTFRLDENKGYGSANNYGSRFANGEYLVLLNPDTLIVDDSISKLLEFYKSQPKLGALTCLLYGKDGQTLQKAFFGKFQSLFGLTIRRYNFQEIDPSKDFMPSDIVTGACLMIKKSLFDKLGGFDENFFMYLEDDDLCKRLTSLGYHNGVCTKAKIIHLEGQSFSSNRQKKEFYYKSQDYYWHKHNGLLATILMKIIRWPYRIVKSM
ncbi:MAG TPA: glycosyltransferase family 2 protein [Patescibacteria group bacterium]|nr:glycosyltransferase family 2 protein [Patescibacteria group bacterium]